MTDLTKENIAETIAALAKQREGRRVPCILFTKGGGLWLEAMRELDCEVLGVDWTVNLGRTYAVLTSILRPEDGQRPSSG